MLRSWRETMKKRCRSRAPSLRHPRRAGPGRTGIRRAQGCDAVATELLVSVGAQLLVSGWRASEFTTCVIPATTSMTGASTRELMGRMGHASMDAALIFQHRTADRDRAIADAIDVMLTGFDELSETLVGTGAGDSG